MSTLQTPLTSYNLEKFQSPKTLHALNSIFAVLSKKHNKILSILHAPIEWKQERIRDKIIGHLGLKVNLNEWKKEPSTIQQLGNSITGAEDVLMRRVLEQGFGIPLSLLQDRAIIRVALYKDLVNHLQEHGHHGPYRSGNTFLELDDGGSPILHRYKEGQGKFTQEVKPQGNVRVLPLKDFKLS